MAGHERRVRRDDARVAHRVVEDEDGKGGMVVEVLIASGRGGSGLRTGLSGGIYTAPPDEGGRDEEREGWGLTDKI